MEKLKLLPTELQNTGLDWRCVKQSSDGHMRVYEARMGDAHLNASFYGGVVENVFSEVIFPRYTVREFTTVADMVKWWTTGL